MRLVEFAASEGLWCFGVRRISGSKGGVRYAAGRYCRSMGVLCRPERRPPDASPGDADIITGKVIANDFALNQDRTDDVEAILGVLSDDLLDEDEIADDLR